MKGNARAKEQAMLTQFTPATKSFLRTIHCLSACGWIGGGLAVLILLKLAGAPAGHEEAEAFQRSITALDDDLIIPSAGVATVSGLLLCCSKPWGFSEHRWIMEKCLITALLLIFGAFWLKPDLQSLVPGVIDTAELDLDYHRHWLWGSTAAILQTVGLLLLVGISIIKPDRGKTSRGKLPVRGTLQTVAVKVVDGGWKGKFRRPR